jgi:hypothetical protein
LIRDKGGSKAADDWFKAGKLLRLAADLDAGVMRMAVVETDGSCAGGEDSTSILPSPMAHIPPVADWKTAFSLGLQPSATVGAALFPAVSGRGGVRLQCNFGLDPRRPLLFPPSKNSRHEQVLLPWTYIKMMITNFQNDDHVHGYDTNLVIARALPFPTGAIHPPPCPNYTSFKKAKQTQPTPLKASPHVLRTKPV